MKIVLRLGKYVSVAMLSAASDWLVFSVLVSALGAPHLTSLMAARVVGGVVSFLSNRHWTWGANRHITITQQGRRFLILYGFSYALSVGTFSLLSQDLDMPAYPAKLITDGLCFGINYAVMLLYVFHQRGGMVVMLANLFGRRNDP